MLSTAQTNQGKSFYIVLGAAGNKEHVVVGTIAQQEQ